MRRRRSVSCASGTCTRSGRIASLSLFAVFATETIDEFGSANASLFSDAAAIPAAATSTKRRRDGDLGSVLLYDMRTPDEGEAISAADSVTRTALRTRSFGSDRVAYVIRRIPLLARL